MNTVVIGLGSNIDPEENIKKSRQILSEKFSVIKETDFIKTKPIGYEKQDDFLNGAILLKTDTSLETLKGELKEIEVTLGRKAAEIQYGPRTIDLDIVVFNGKIIDDDFYQRDFIKESVLKLLPELEY